MTRLPATRGHVTRLAAARGQLVATLGHVDIDMALHTVYSEW